MTDRVPGAPGQYKAVITADELLKLQKGEQFSITMIRDDQPITEGTPYSKDAVLPDDTAKIFCPGILDPNPANVFAVIASSGCAGTMTYINAESTNLISLLNPVYSAMADRSIKQVVFADAALGASIRWYGTLWRYSGNYGLLQARSTGGISVQRNLSAGEWGPWEYVNPPMEKGNEYRTTERWLGKPVYIQLLDVGKVDGTMFHSFPVRGVTNIIRANVKCGDLCEDATSDEFKYSVHHTESGINITTYADSSLVGQQMYATVYYTR